VPEDLPDAGRWAGLKRIGVAISDTVRSGKSCDEICYYILSKKMSARSFGAAVRSHWSIENSLHWQLDISFGEDRSRVRKDHADANMAELRRLALGLLKNEASKKVGIKNQGFEGGVMYSFSSSPAASQWRRAWSSLRSPASAAGASGHGSAYFYCHSFRKLLTANGFIMSDM